MIHRYDSHEFILKQLDLSKTFGAVFGSESQIDLAVGELRVYFVIFPAENIKINIRVYGMEFFQYIGKKIYGNAEYCADPDQSGVSFCQGIGYFFQVLLFGSDDF